MSPTDKHADDAPRIRVTAPAKRQTATAMAGSSDPGGHPVDGWRRSQTSRLERAYKEDGELRVPVRRINRGRRRAAGRGLRHFGRARRT